MTSGALRRFRPGGRAAYEVATTAPPEELTAALVRNLATTVGGQAAYAVPAELGQRIVESWPPGLSSVAGAVGVAPVGGTGSVFVLSPSRWDDGARALLRDTAAWLGVAVRLARSRAEHDAVDLRARRLRAELAAARTRLARVRDLERHRLVRVITATTLRDLDTVREALRGVAEGDAELDTVQEALDELFDNFRVVVRGVFPAMLPDRGPRAALTELAATLPRPVTFAGDLGRRAGWQLESAFYHAVAAALNLLAGEDSPDPVRLTFGRDDALRVRIVAPGVPDDGELRTALAHDIERIAVLGGELVCQVTDGSAVVTVRLTERVEPVPPAAVNVAALESSAIYRAVRDLVRQGQELAAGLPERAEWDAVAERLAMPPHLAVVGSTSGVLVEGVSVVVVDAQADRALAEEFLTTDGARGGVDAVVCPAETTPEFRRVMWGGRGRVMLVEDGSVEEVAGTLAARAPVIVARRAVVAMTELVGRFPADHLLRTAVEQVAADAHEFAELDLLDDVARGRALRGDAAEAARLLGAVGVDARSRLGLAAAATHAEVTAAALDVVNRWRTQAGHAATGGRDRAACEVLVRTAEGLLAT